MKAFINVNILTLLLLVKENVFESETYTCFAFAGLIKL